MLFSATGKRSNQWSMVTIRMGRLHRNPFNILILMFYLALAVYTRSSAAYEALKSFEIIQLPSRSTLQSYTGSFLHEPGASNQCIADQVAQYVTFKAECEKQGS